MKEIVLYCKSYCRDFLRLKRLLSSINQYNVDQIPFYISTPQNQYQDLISVLGNIGGYHWVSDESIIAANPRVSRGIEKTRSGSLSQQVIKAEFWRLKVSVNYLCLDSDCVFIRAFSRKDFLTSDSSLLTVLHQNKEYFQLAFNRGKEKLVQNLRAEAKRVQTLFDREGPEFYCAPAPFLWSSAVWDSLDREYLQPKNITLWELVDREHPETLIYGEALLKYRAIPLIAIEPLFRVYHYDWHYFLMARVGEVEERLRENYLGVIYQSTWDIAADLNEKKKSKLSLLVKKLKRFLNRINSYI